LARCARFFAGSHSYAIHHDMYKCTLVASATALRPNVEGNRPADGMQTEDQSMCRRVRLTVRLGVGLHRRRQKQLFQSIGIMWGHGRKRF
jgi:hypothetical protein